MIWNGTDPLQPDHEVAYRGWPTESTSITYVVRGIAICTEGKQGYIVHNADGTCGRSGDSPYDLIPLQQQEPAK